MSMNTKWKKLARLGIKIKVFPVHVVHKYGGGGLWYTHAAHPYFDLALDRRLW